MSAAPTFTWEGSIPVGGLRIRAYVLDDGKRVLDPVDVHRFFASSARGTPEEFAQLAEFCKGRGKP